MYLDNDQPDSWQCQIQTISLLCANAVYVGFGGIASVADVHMHNG